MITCKFVILFLYYSISSNISSCSNSIIFL